MNKPLIVIHNTESNEIIEREMNASELAQYESDKAKAELKRKAEVEAVEKKAAAEAKLSALGLTTDDLKALGLA